MNPEYKAHVDSLPLPAALWWFIENVSADDPDRTEWFFYLRERYRAEGETQ